MNSVIKFKYTVYSKEHNGMEDLKHPHDVVGETPPRYFYPTNGDKFGPTQTNDCDSHDPHI